MIFDQAEFFILALVVIPFTLWLRRKKSWPALFYHSLFYIYLAGVISQTLFPIHLSLDLGFSAQPEHIETELFRYFVLRDALLNVLLTLPFGWLYPLVWRHSWRKTILLALVFPCLIESLQLLILFLTPNYPRVVDISDVLFNFLGVMLGYIMYRLILGQRQPSE